jgi:hypothetical protein
MYAAVMQKVQILDNFNSTLDGQVLYFMELLPLAL